MPLTLPSSTEITQLLSPLFGREISATVADSAALHPRTVRGLVNDANDLVAVIGSDLGFAHRTGAAIAMMPVAHADEAGYDQPDDDLIENYQEVANVLSRAVNENSPERLRLDPGLQHDIKDLAAVITGGSGAVYQIDLPGYGSGRFGIYSRA